MAAPKPIQFTVPVLLTVDPEAYAREYGEDPDKARRLSRVEEMTEDLHDLVIEAVREALRPFDFIKVQ